MVFCTLWCKNILSKNCESWPQRSMSHYLTPEQESWLWVGVEQLPKPSHLSNIVWLFKTIDNWQSCTTVYTHHVRHKVLILIIPHARCTIPLSNFYYLHIYLNRNIEAKNCKTYNIKVQLFWVKWKFCGIC